MNMNEKNVNRTTNNDNKRITFYDVVRTYSEAPTDEHLQSLSRAVALSVLKKLIDTTHNETLIKIRADLLRACNNLDGIAWANTDKGKEIYTDNGNVKTEYDKDKTDTMNRLIQENLGVGYDLAQEAAVAIWAASVDQKLQNPNEPIDLTRPYSIRVLDKRVIIRGIDSIAWKDVETTPIREIFRAVRREIELTRGASYDTSGYSYVERAVTDSETGAVATVYDRQQKYADIGGYVCDFNGRETVYTASPATVDEIEAKKQEIIDKCRLDKIQKTVLDLRLRGYGDKAIGTYLGKQPRLIRRHRNQMGAKCYAIGFKPDGMNEPPTVK